MNNIILIGMPGSGKSTVGLLLAKELAKDFIDTDLLIQRREGCALQRIVDDQGYIYLRDIEEAVLLDLDVEHCVIATGGSAVYSAKGMRHLRELGQIVYLDVELDELRARINNYASRGIARRQDQTLADLFVERRLLYQRFADITVRGSDKPMTAVVDDLIQQL